MPGRMIWDELVADQIQEMKINRAKIRLFPPDDGDGGVLQRVELGEALHQSFQARVGRECPDVRAQ